jgi:cysteine-rich repeat protein
MPVHQACQSVCGDGITLGTEDCDDSNTTNDDGWKSSVPSKRVRLRGEPSTCQTIVERIHLRTEECDDGNPDNFMDAATAVTKN